MDNIILRAHHGMCLQYYEGKGYSHDFTDHMWNVLKDLDDNKLITVTASADCVCSHCPNLYNKTCMDYELVKHFDEEVLNKCKVSPGSVLTWGKFRTIVKNNILLQGIRTDICGNCRWNSICLEKDRELMALRK